MSSFWPKIITLGIIVAILVAVVKFLPETKKEKAPEPSLSESFRHDDERLRAEPEPVEEVQPEAQEQPQEQPTEEPEQVEESVPESILDAPAQPEQVEGEPRQFVLLSEIENIEAERLFEQAVTFRKTARVQTGFKAMVDVCRQIIEKFPGTEWEFKAKRLLTEIPERYHERYKITEEELDLGGYK